MASTTTSPKMLDFHEMGLDDRLLKTSKPSAKGKKRSKPDQMEKSGSENKITKRKKKTKKTVQEASSKSKGDPAQDEEVTLNPEMKPKGDPKEAKVSNLKKASKSRRETARENQRVSEVVRKVTSNSESKLKHINTKQGKILKHKKDILEASKEEGTNVKKEANVSESKTQKRKNLKKVKADQRADSSTAGKFKARLQISSGDAWGSDGEETKSCKRPSEDSDSESDIEENTDSKEPPKKKTKKQLEDEARAEEAFLYQTERSLMDEGRAPESLDDFDRMVTTSPSSSIVWIRFMAFHLDAGETEKARAVAERALKTIGFREEQEKLNVWVALMNLENTNGTDDQLIRVFERALLNCEPIKVFPRLIEIYVHSKKIDSADALYNTMLKRFKTDKSVWIQYGTFLMQHGKYDAAMALMRRSFKSLVKKDHIDVISRFAQLEYKLGEPERGQTMFENILSNYPKRTDIWSIYLDMVIKVRDVESTRRLFERVITLNLSPKKIKFFFKRYLEFEKEHGTEGLVNAIKQKAVEYVESKSGLTNET